MKTYIYIIMLSVIFTSSCTSEKPKSEIKDTTRTEIIKLSKAEFEIEGMTCQIGCAKMIASKLSKIEGVDNIEVSFENRLGTISYNSNKINKQQIIDTVEKIANGTLYRVKTFELK